MRIGHIKYRARRRTKKLQEEKTEDHEKQRLATLKRLKQDDENELESKLRLEKVVASKQLRLAVEIEEKRRGCSYQSARVGHGDGRRKKSKIGEDCSSKQFSLAT